MINYALELGQTANPEAVLFYILAPLAVVAEPEAGIAVEFTAFAAAAESANDSKIFMIGLSAVLTMILR